MTYACTNSSNSEETKMPESNGCAGICQNVERCQYEKVGNIFQIVQVSPDKIQVVHVQYLYDTAVPPDASDTFCATVVLSLTLFQCKYHIFRIIETLK